MQAHEQVHPAKTQKTLEVDVPDLIRLINILKIIPVSCYNNLYCLLC